jgi:hypothetical protein
VATWSKACVYDHWIGGFKGSNTFGGLEYLSVVNVVCVDRYKCVRWADPSSREILPSVFVRVRACVCIYVCVCVCACVRVI